MAIDTREKRASLIGINYVMGPTPTPNAAKDQEWRQQVGYGYSGILAGAGGGPTTNILNFERGFGRGFARGFGGYA